MKKEILFRLGEASGRLLDFMGSVFYWLLRVKFTDYRVSPGIDTAPQAGVCSEDRLANTDPGSIDLSTDNE